MSLLDGFGSVHSTGSVVGLFLPLVWFLFFSGSSFWYLLCSLVSTSRAVTPKGSVGFSDQEWLGWERERLAAARCGQARKEEDENGQGSKFEE